MKHQSFLLAIFTVALLFVSIEAGRAQSTAFTYQGSLRQNNVAANGNFDIQFGLFTNSTSGNPTATATLLNVPVTNGLFTTTLDFGNVFDGRAFWLDIAVRTGGSSDTFASLSTRQPLTATPYALFAPTATTTGYLFVYDTTTQSVGSANSFQNINFNPQPTQNTPAPIINGWAPQQVGPGSSQFTATNSGLYLFEYQAELSGTANRTASFRGTLNFGSVNFAEIVGSEAAVTLGTNALTSISKSFLSQVNSNDVFRLQFTSDGSTVSLVPGTGSPQRPSASLTIIRIK